MNIQRSQFLSINELQEQYLNRQPVKPAADTNRQGLTFEEIWKEKTGQLDEGLRFSKHASNRLADRSIVLS
ncbi:MAG: flagellar protein, partial [Lachnospiraceae bacterium]